MAEAARDYPLSYSVAAVERHAYMADAVTQ
jgi:hypothetical protein